MINEEFNCVRAATIDSAWREVMWLCVKNGYDFMVKGGSYVGQIRKQLEDVKVVIDQPWTRPLAPIMPPSIPPPTSDMKIEEYLVRYILGNEKTDNEVYCYSEDTEILTDSGWKLFKDLDKTEKVATLNPDDNTIGYQLPEKYYEFDFKGQMNNITSRSLDVLVNDKHKVFCTDANNEFTLRNITDVGKGTRRVGFKKDGVWGGEEQNFFTLPGVAYDNGHYRGGERKVAMDDWLAFLGIWLAEGSLRNNSYGVVITQKNNTNRGVIFNKLQETFPNIIDCDGRLLISDKQLHTYLTKFGRAHQKYIPRELFGLTSRQLEILFNWMYLGDGHKNSGCLIYTTCSKRLADDVQELALLIGKSADMHVQEPSSEKSIQKRTAYKLTIKSGAFAIPHIFPNKHISKVPYDGKLYCVQVTDYHIVYIRRNGKTCWCGNTYGEFISEQLPRILELLVSSNGNTNQATICIGNVATTFLDDPPCLRSVSFKVVEGRLNMTVYFRSWDLYAGFPENLGGLQRLKEVVLDHLQDCGLEVEDGKIIAFSDGLHLYDQYFQIVDTLNVDKVQVGAQALKDKEEFLVAEGV